MLNPLKIIINIYKQCVINITAILMDRKFGCLRENLPEVNLNNTVASDHIPGIKRHILTTEVLTCSTNRKMNFNQIPDQMIFEFLNNTVMCLNYSPLNSSVFEILGTQVIMNSTTLEFVK